MRWQPFFKYLPLVRFYLANHHFLSLFKQVWMIPLFYLESKKQFHCRQKHLLLNVIIEVSKNANTVCRCRPNIPNIFAHWHIRIFFKYLFYHRRVGLIRLNRMKFYPSYQSRSFLPILHHPLPLINVFDVFDQRVLMNDSNVRKKFSLQSSTSPVHLLCARSKELSTKACV